MTAANCGREIVRTDRRVDNYADSTQSPSLGGADCESLTAVIRLWVDHFFSSQVKRQVTLRSGSLILQAEWIVLSLVGFGAGPDATIHVETCASRTGCAGRGFDLQAGEAEEFGLIVGIV